MARAIVGMIAGLLGWLALVAPALAAEPQFPPLTGRVVDSAGVIPDDIERRLTDKLAALETQSRRQLVVVTLPSLQGYEISDYGYRLGRAWGLGDKARNDGALLIVAPNERKLRIEVGYGLEAVLTDGLSSLIVNQTIVPRLKAGDMAGGIEAGADAIITQLTLPEAEAQRIAQAANARPAAGGGGLDPGLIVFVAFVLLFFVLPLVRGLRGGGRGSRRSGLPGVVVWPSGGGWGGGSGGGFSGGGGSFGGGGASGGW